MLYGEEVMRVGLSWPSPSFRRVKKAPHSVAEAAYAGKSPEAHILAEAGYGRRAAGIVVYTLWV